MRWNIFSRGDSYLNSLEKRVVEEVKSKLSPDARELLDRQLQEINLVQRPSKRETNVYTIKSGKATRNPKFRFPNETKELKFATVKLKSAPGQVLTAELYIVTGYFFSIVFNSDSNSVKGKSGDIEVLETKIHQNPMLRLPTDPDHVHHEPVLSGWLEEWEHKYNIGEKKPALKQSDRERLLANISGSLPLDYLELTMQSDGFKIENCTIFGPSGIHGIVMPDGDYYVLAEVEKEGVIAVKSNGDGMQYFLDFDENPPETLGTSFQSAIENYVDTS